MAKNKQQKKKDREKRVAKKKHEADAKKRTQEKTAKETQKNIPERANLMKPAVPKTNNIPTSKKSTFTQRRTGG